MSAATIVRNVNTSTFVEHGRRVKGGLRAVAGGKGSPSSRASTPSTPTHPERGRGRTGLTRATARRLLLTLGQLGYVSTNGRQFSLTPRVLDIGYAYLSSLNVQQIAQPYLEPCPSGCTSPVSVTVLDGADIVYIARMPTKRIMTISLGSAAASRLLHVDGSGAAGRAGTDEPDATCPPRWSGTPNAPSPPSPSWRSCWQVRPRGGHWSTRSWRWACGRRPPRCGTLRAGRWRP